MASPSYTHTLTNNTTADADQVMQNFNDILNGVTDGTKDLSIAALTVAGTATFNGNVTLGNATADTITPTGRIAGDLVPNADGSINLGTSALGYASLYLGDTQGDTMRIIPASLSADRSYTIPDAGGDTSFVMLAGAQTLTGVKTLTTPVIDDYADINEEAEPSSPASGKVRIYSKTDKTLYSKDSAGVISVLGYTVDYAYNTDQSTTANPSSNGAESSATTGSGGIALHASNWAVGTRYTRRVVWPTACQAGDLIIVEIDPDGTNGHWVPASQHYPSLPVSTARYGITVVPVSTTKTDILFRESGANASAAATYGANGGSWSGESPAKWRVARYRFLIF